MAVLKGERETSGSGTEPYAGGLLFCCRTDTGKVRTRNEDSILADGRNGIFAVADGLGGHRGGEVASRTAIETVREVLAGPPAGQPQPAVEERLARAVEHAHDRIRTMAASDPGLAGMGTTISIVCVAPPRIVTAHVGDSRILLYRDRHVRRLTADHTIVDLLLRKGDITQEEARNHCLRHVLTQSLGSDTGVVPDIAAFGIEHGDAVILCSDGLTNMVSEDEIGRILETAWPHAGACDRLVQLANDRGGSDNISVIILSPALWGRPS